MHSLSTFFAVMLMVSAVHALAPLPEGNTGIAAQYPADAGIWTNSAVVFADDFESYSNASGLSARWNGGVYHYADFVTSGPNVFAGAKSLRFRNPKQAEELSNTVDRLVHPKLDALFLRYYSKFDATFDVTGSSHNGCSVQASYIVNGVATPGVKANGYNKFLANYECWRGEAKDPSPGYLNVYLYHPEQRDVWGDHFFPTGIIMPWTSVPGDFGPDFTPRPDIAPQLGRWYCYEFMVRANTPGRRDGRIACWLDGKVIADFPNLRLRDIDTLKIDRFGISCHIKSNTVRETYKYYDNVVAATSYIGPMTAASSTVQPLKQPSMLKKIPAQCIIYDFNGRQIRCDSREDDKEPTGFLQLTGAKQGQPGGLCVCQIRRGKDGRVMKRVMLR